MVGMPRISQLRSSQQQHEEEQRDTDDDSSDDSDVNDEGVFGEAQGQAIMDGAEQLKDQDLQNWALGLGCVALPWLLWAQSVPLSCVYMDLEKSEWPSKHCQHIVGGSEALRLHDFCMKTCMQKQPHVFVAFLCLALVLQALVVIMNHGKCLHFLKIGLTVDFQKQTEELQASLNQEDPNESSGMVWRNVKHYGKKAFVNIMLGLRETVSKSSTRRVMLTPRVLVRFSQMSLLGALCMTGMLVLNNFSKYPIELDCGSDEPLTLEYTQSWFHIIAGHLVVVIILLTVLFLQQQARYSVQVRFKKSVNVSTLKKQFKEHGDNFFLKKDHNCYKRKLKGVYLRPLETVEHDGYMDEPKTAFDFEKWEGPVTLHFKLKKPMRWPFADNWHRIAAIQSCFLTALCFVSSSQLCWLCVGSIKTIRDITVIQLENYLDLLGACGRHPPIGMGSLLGAVMFFAACFIQSMLWKLTDPAAIGNNTPGCYSACLKVIRATEKKAYYGQQLWLKVFSETLGDVILDMSVYERADVQPEDIPEIWCYVWVTMVASSQEQKETIQNVDSTSGSAPQKQGKDQKEQGNDRKKWRKSTQPVKVKLVKPPPEENLHHWLRGLVRYEYGIPVLAVEVPKQGDMQNACKQMIPLQFVAGGPTVWLNLGRKHSWEKVSGALAFGAVVIVLAEILFSYLYPYGKILQTCDDILNTPCTDYAIGFEQKQPIEFRRTMGTWMAMLGCCFAMIATTCIRVANQADGGKISAGFCGGFCAYLQALFFTLQKAKDVVVFVCTSLFSCVRACCKRRCCPGKKKSANADESLILEREPLNKPP